MTTIDTSALSARATWTRFIAAADTDKDGELNGAELEALVPKDKVERIISLNDKNDDGKLSADETPKGAFNAQLMAVLLGAQAYRDASPEQRATDDMKAIHAFFARADVDGDGYVSKDELDADRAISMAAFLDTGELPDTVVMARGAPDGTLRSPEDFMVGRAVKLEPVPASELPEDWQVQFRNVREAAEEANPELKSGTLPDGRAEITAKLTDTPMSNAFLTRLALMLGQFTQET